MRPIVILFALVLLGGIARAGEVPAMADTCFVPAETCAPRIVDAIATARNTILVQAYGFTSSSILGALAAAHRRGVHVKVIVDRSAVGRCYNGATFVGHAGILVCVDQLPTIAQTKAIIVNEMLVIGGSFNFTRSADQRNVEDVTFMRSRELAQRFTAA